MAVRCLHTRGDGHTKRETTAALEERLLATGQLQHVTGGAVRQQPFTTRPLAPMSDAER